MAKVPVVPVYVSGTDKLAACFIGKEKLNVVIGQPVTTDKITSFDDDKDGYRGLADEIMNRIKDLKAEFDGRLIN